MNVRPLRLGLSELFVFSVLILSGCASRPDTAQQAATYEEDFNDPLEDANRKIFEFNQFVDRNAIVPVAKAYREPRCPTRCAIHCAIFSIICARR